MINTETYTKFILEHIPENIWVPINNNKGEKNLRFPVKLNITAYSTYFQFSYTFLDYENVDVLFISNKHSPRQIYDRLCTKLYTHINETINDNDRDKIIENYGLKALFFNNNVKITKFTSITDLENHLKNK